MKLCKDCRHIQRDKEGDIVEPGICMHRSLAMKTINYVTGRESEEHPTCQLSRLIGACSKEGVLWEEAAWKE